MKKDSHPQYYNAKVTCACGNAFTVGSTKEEIKIEVCAACHPFFTGEQRFVDTEGRVDKFVRKIEEAKLKSAEVKSIKDAKSKRRAEEKKNERPQSLKDLLEEEKKEVEDKIPTDKNNSPKSESPKNTGKNK